MGKINVAIVGVGNCAASLVQGIEHYSSIANQKPGKNKPVEHLGLMNYDMGGYLPHDIEVVAAFDIDKRKVGERLDVALAVRRVPLAKPGGANDRLRGAVRRQGQPAGGAG